MAKARLTTATGCEVGGVRGVEEAALGHAEAEHLLELGAGCAQFGMDAMAGGAGALFAVGGEEEIDVEAIGERGDAGDGEAADAGEGAEASGERAVDEGVGVELPVLEVGQLRGDGDDVVCAEAERDVAEGEDGPGKEARSRPGGRA